MEVMLAAQWEVEQLRAGATCLEERDRELATLHSEFDRLRNEATCLRMERTNVWGDTDHLREERSQFRGFLRETRLRAEEAKSTLREANAHLEEVNLELLKERNAAEGQPLSFPREPITCRAKPY